MAGAGAKGRLLYEMIRFHRSCLFDVTWGELCQHELRPRYRATAVRLRHHYILNTGLLVVHSSATVDRESLSVPVGE